jgi:hypothetical protein
MSLEADRLRVVRNGLAMMRRVLALLFLLSERRRTLAFTANRDCHWGYHLALPPLTSGYRRPAATKMIRIKTIRPRPPLGP